MSSAAPSFIRDKVAPAARGMGRLLNRAWRRLAGKPRPAEEQSLFPLVIQVLAAFSKSQGQIVEEEVDTVLGLLRHGFPDAVYSDLRRQFREALGQQQDVNAMADKLSRALKPEQKVMLGVQLYDIISQPDGGERLQQMPAFYTFMEKLGMAAQAIEIVHQLQGGERADKSLAASGELPLEVLTFGRDAQSDVWLKSLQPGERLIAFRYHDLVLVKNTSQRRVFVRGRPLSPGAFCRIFAGQRVVLDEQVLTFQDLAYYFNAKKGVYVTQVYVELNDNDEVELSRVRSRTSVLEVRFGLKVQVRALGDVDALLNGVALRTGTMLNATLEDRLVFHHDAELALSDLRRRARALGVRFQLKSYKSSYQISNNPSMLETDDILLSPGTAGDVLLKVLCDYDNKVGKLEVVSSGRPVVVGDKIIPVGGSCDLKDDDFIRIDSGQGIRCDFSERIIEEQRNIVSQLELRDLTCHFGGKATALDGISFNLTRGDIVCVMGGSGSGKSTLLRAIAGRMPPARGQVLLNNQPLYHNLDELKRFIAYVPQDDAFDDHLTVEENLRYAAAIRSPHLSRRDRERRVDSRLVELGLAERRDVVVGSADKKTLSGGERKRLNIGLDMISSADIFLFDEPTSGLSSKDSEHVIEVIRGLAHNKIVLVVIHQPSARLFSMFTKAVLLDRGGKLVFFGKPSEMLSYFSAAAIEEKIVAPATVRAESGSPEFAFDVLETPLHDLSGDAILEEATNGQLIPARRFSPDFWRDRYEAHRLTLDVKMSIIRKAKPGAPAPSASPSSYLPQLSTVTFAGDQSGSFSVPVPRMSTPEERAAAKRKTKGKGGYSVPLIHFFLFGLVYFMLNGLWNLLAGNRIALMCVMVAVWEPLRWLSVSWSKLRWKEEWLQFHTLMRRSFLSKLRNLSSLFVTLLAPPLLATIVGWALYFNKDADRAYMFASAFHIPTYIFIALLVALFLALMNSVEDVIRDRTVLQRERNLDVRMTYYVTAKFLTLCVFSALQCALFVVVGNNILEVRGMFGEYFLWTFLTAVSGISLGLLVSALVPNSKTGALLVPLILIPQLIFGGALIKYDEMNKDPDLVYSFRRLFDGRRQQEEVERDKKLEVPLISKLISTHYSYEALVVAQAKLNPLNTRQELLNDMIRQLASVKGRTEEQDNRLWDLKDTLAQLSGLNTGSAREIDRRLAFIDAIIAGRPSTKGDFKSREEGVRITDVYENQKITDMVSKAESEQADYRRSYKVNAFFSPKKYFSIFGIGSFTLSVWAANAAILLGTSLVMLIILGLVLRGQLRRTGV